MPRTRIKRLSDFTCLAIDEIRKLPYKALEKGLSYFHRNVGRRDRRAALTETEKRQLRRVRAKYVSAISNVQTAQAVKIVKPWQEKALGNVATQRSLKNWKMAFVPLSDIGQEIRYRKDRKTGRRYTVLVSKHAEVLDVKINSEHMAGLHTRAEIAAYLSELLAGRKADSLAIGIGMGLLGGQGEHQELADSVDSAAAMLCNMVDTYRERPGHEGFSLEYLTKLRAIKWRNQKDKSAYLKEAEKHYRQRTPKARRRLR